MILTGDLAKRFERYDDERLAGALAEIEGLPLSPFESRIVDDIKAEQARRAAVGARSATEVLGRDSAQ